MTFQAWKITFLDSMTFQVFHILYEPCPDWRGVPPTAASGSRRRVHKDQGWDSQHCILSTACAEMPTSRDLKSGDSLFFTSPLPRKVRTLYQVLHEVDTIQIRDHCFDARNNLCQ